MLSIRTIILRTLSQVIKSNSSQVDRINTSSASYSYLMSKIRNTEYTLDKVLNKEGSPSKSMAILLLFPEK
ncbi:hypothetical protein ANTRET_LOCUS3162 [Anthophora retusa]